MKNDNQSTINYEELELTVNEMKNGDRVHFFWTNFPDGNVINGGTNIIEIKSKVPAPSPEWIEQEGWTTDKLEEFENLRSADKLVLVTIQTDYYDPSTIVMDKEMPVRIIREILN